MYISVVRKTLLCTSVLIFAAIGNATPLTWTLTAFAPTLTGVPGVGGTFTYDADTNQILNWDIHDCIEIHCGTIAHNPEPDLPADSRAEASNGGTTLRFDFTASAIDNVVRLELTAPLTNAGGTIPLIPGSDGSSGPGFIIGSGSAYWFVVQNGNGAFYPFTDGTVGAAPEPGFGSCTALFVLALAGIEAYTSRRRKSVVMGE